MEVKTSEIIIWNFSDPDRRLLPLKGIAIKLGAINNLCPDINSSLLLTQVLNNRIITLPNKGILEGFKAPGGS